MLRIRKYELLMGAVLAVALGLCLPYFISYYVYGDYSGKEAQAAEIIPVERRGVRDTHRAGEPVRDRAGAIFGAVRPDRHRYRLPDQYPQGHLHADILDDADPDAVWHLHAHPTR